jgi:hypothetical protein
MIKKLRSFPSVADPLFDHSLVIAKNLNLPRNFSRQHLSDYLPQRHREVRKRWTDSWGKTIANRLACFKIEEGVHAVTQRLNCWAVAKEQSRKANCMLLVTAKKIQEEIGNVEILSEHLKGILIRKWGEARRYRTSRYVDSCYQRIMSEMAGKEKNLVHHLLQAMRWKERFTEAISKEAGAIGLEIEVETSSPWFIRGEEIPIVHQTFPAVKTTTQPQLSTVS